MNFKFSEEQKFVKQTAREFQTKSAVFWRRHRRSPRKEFQFPKFKAEQHQPASLVRAPVLCNPYSRKTQPCLWEVES